MKILAIESSCDETAAAVVEDGAKILSNVVVSQIDIFAEYGGVIPEVAARSHLEAILPVVHRALEEARLTKDDIDCIAVTHMPGLLGSLLIGTLTARMLAILWGKPIFAVHHLKSHIYANWLNDESAGDSSLSSSQNGLLGGEVPEFPLLALVVSGGHTQIIYMRGHNQFEIIGTTRDDAVGECFDKVAKVLGLPYPGGPSIAKCANGEVSALFETVDKTSGHQDSVSSRKSSADVTALTFAKQSPNEPGMSNVSQSTETPSSAHVLNSDSKKGATDGTGLKMGVTDDTRPKIGTTDAARAEWYKMHPNYRLPHPKVEGLDFSFSGLKTAVLRAVQKELGVPISTPSYELAGKLTEEQRADFATAFQETACEILIEKLEMALEQHPEARSVVIAGGVSANAVLREKAQERLLRASDGVSRRVFFPELKFAGDNAAMVGAAAYYQIQAGDEAADPYDFSIAPRCDIGAKVDGKAEVR